MREQPEHTHCFGRFRYFPIGFPIPIGSTTLWLFPSLPSLWVERGWDADVWVVDVWDTDVSVDSVDSVDVVFMDVLVRLEVVRLRGQVGSHAHIVIWFQSQ